MNQDLPANSSSWGFISPDGNTQPIEALSLASLEYVSKTMAELQKLIKQHIVTEEYEKCALIRDEISKRLQ
jgi:hypothetical protein